MYFFILYFYINIFFLFNIFLLYIYIYEIGGGKKLYLKKYIIIKLIKIKYKRNLFVILIGNNIR